MTQQTRILCALGLFCSTSLALAAPMEDAAQALCNKVKDCSLAQIAEEDMTDEMRQMMEPMLENMCANMRAGVENVSSDHELYKPAVACMEAMAAMSCAEIQAMDDAEPAACVEYRRLAREVYGE